MYVMRRYYSIMLLFTAILSSCDSDGEWTLQQQNSRINALIADSSATSSDFRAFISDIETGLWAIDNWIVSRNGELWSSSYTSTENIAYTSGSQFLDMIFYADGSCRQCYIASTPPDESSIYPYLYTTLLWSFDSSRLAVNLVNTALEATSAKYATTSLILRYYQYGEFIMDGLQPTSNNLDGYTVRYIGTVASPAARTAVESKFHAQ